MPRPAIHLQPLPYVDALATRDPAAIDTVVLHCTELPDLATARAYGERVHYARSGEVYLVAGYVNLGTATRPQPARWMGVFKKFGDKWQYGSLAGGGR